MCANAKRYAITMFEQAFISALIIFSMGGQNIVQT